MTKAIRRQISEKRSSRICNSFCWNWIKASPFVERQQRIRFDDGNGLKRELEQERERALKKFTQQEAGDE